MLNWLLGRKKPPAFPGYTLLRENPSHTLPATLVEQESGPEFKERRDGIQTSLESAESDRPIERHFFIPANSGGASVALVLPDGQCLMVFSSGFRAADFCQTTFAQLSDGLRVVPVTGFCDLLRNCEQAGISLWTLDRCPRCTVVTTMGTDQFTTAAMVTRVWAIQHATAQARFDLYLAHALDSARAGDFATARDVALETVGHVDAENPRPHMLLGQLGVATGDRTLVDEAMAFLGFFQQHAWREKLGAVVQSGQPNFER